MVPPSSYGRVDVPVTSSREITGRVVRLTNGSETPVPRARLELVEVETGEARPFHEIAIAP
ncbi:MAG: hypothetical protein P8188_07925 [Gemmatimonadota bacterium]